MLNVIKRDGSKEPLDIEKIHKVVIWATENLTGVSASEVAMKSKIQFYDGITTSTIHETLIKAASELISEDAPNYQYVAGRLVNYTIRKEVYGEYAPISLYDLIKRNVASGFYDKSLLVDYTEEEWKKINTFVDHNRDMSLTYAAMEQLRGKYLVQNRVTKQLMETPQMVYILVAAVVFARYPKETRMIYVKDYYEAISKHDISLPTPIMAGLRTPQRQFSSCVLIETDDSLKSITKTTEAIVSYVSQKAGIGIGAGRIRALKSSVRNGDTSHTGITPFYKLFQAAVGSCSQGGVRSGASTVFFPFFHLDIEDMIVLKNNKGTEDNRVRRMDYAVQFNKFFYERLISGGSVTLFSPHDVKEVYEAFFNDQEKFKLLYENAEQNPNIRKKSIKAIELFTSFVQERKETGRIYLMHSDHANTHSSFIESKAPVRQSNLCCEILLPVIPMGTTKIVTEKVKIEEIVPFLQAMSPDKVIQKTTVVDDESVEIEMEQNISEIALCTLSSINWGNIKDPSDFERPCRLAVRALDEILDYQNYPMQEAERSTMAYRPLGIGVTNLAYWLAKNDLKYSDNSALIKLDEYAEAWSYYMIKASVDLAKEKGPCDRIENVKYGLGIMPVDTRKIEIDELIPHVERMPWQKLRDDAKQYGIRNATLLAIMPGETSSQVCNATNGIEPPRSYVSVKASKDGILKQVVPEFKKLKKKYELLWDQKSPEGYLNICAVLQKYMDQAISVNTSYNPEHYPDGKIPLSEMIKHILQFYKFGGKNLYYYNTMDGQGEIDVNKLSVQDIPQGEFIEEDCDSCKI